MVMRDDTAFAKVLECQELVEHILSFVRGHTCRRAMRVCSAWRHFLRRQHRNVAWPSELLQIRPNAGDAANEAHAAKAVQRLMKSCPRRTLACCIFVEEESDEVVLRALASELPPRCKVVGTSAGGGLSQVRAWMGGVGGGAWCVAWRGWWMVMDRHASKILVP